MITDCIVLGWLAFSFICGMMKGFMKTLLGPIGLVVATIAATIYYNKTSNIPFALVIGIFGPFLFTLCFSMILKLWNKSVSDGKDLSMFSRVLGGFMNSSWIAAILFLILVLLTLVPKDFKILEPVARDLKNSITYTFIEKNFSVHFQKVATEATQKIVEVMEDPEKVEEIAESPSYQKVMDNSNFASFINDSNVQQQLKAQDIGAIVANPQFQEILKDKNLMNDLLVFYKELMGNYVINADVTAPIADP